MYHYAVRDDQRIRLIINTDAKNEADDQFCIVHACLTPKFDIKGIIGAHFGTHRTPDSMQESVDECNKLMKMMGLDLPVLHGAKRAVASPEDYEYSEGAKLIVEEAMKDNDEPLYAIFLGPLTDLACAYLRCPDIAGRLTAIWIGGGAYPEGGFEYNLFNDVLAANIIFKSPIELWQVPNDTYSRMIVSYAELEEKVRPCGEVGAYLFEQLMEFEAGLPFDRKRPWPIGECWSLGDSPAVGLLLNPQEFMSHKQEAPVIDEKMKYQFSGNGREIRVYHDIDSRFILEDMFCKLKLNYGVGKNE